MYPILPLEIFLNTYFQAPLTLTYYVRITKVGDLNSFKIPLSDLDRHGYTSSDPQADLKDRAM